MLADVPVKTRRKLIEVTLPLDAINAEARREKSIRHGHPSTLHAWWARRPLAAARSVIFSQMVDDPAEYTNELLADPAAHERAARELRVRHAAWEERLANRAAAAAAGDVVEAAADSEPTIDECAADLERERLSRLIEELVKWENATDESLLERARVEIRRSWHRACADNRDHPRAGELFDPDHPPAFHDPFAGGGALPLEAQRLGLTAYASDINPVAVLINKAMIEIPPRFAGWPPVNPASRREAGHSGTWNGAAGLSDDVKHYGTWMREEAGRRIGHLYPPIEVTSAMAADRPDLRPYVGRKLTVIAWLWARTVKSPNPAFAQVDVPLVSTFMLSTKPGKEVYVDPVFENGNYRFAVKVGRPPDVEAAKSGTKLGRGAFKCLMSGSPFPYSYIDDEANSGRMGVRLLAIVAEGDRGRLYLPPSAEHEAVALSATPDWKPDTPCRGTWASNAQGRRYGFRTFGDYFTNRQLVALGTVSGLIGEATTRIREDALAAGLPSDSTALSEGGAGAHAYAEAVSVYLAFAVSKIANIGSSVASWMSDRGAFRETFARQGIAMAWDFAEANPFAEAGGSLGSALDKGAMVIDALPASSRGAVSQLDATSQSMTATKIVSTDPPYYDNIGYADLSDFFYVWLRRSLHGVFPELFATLATPKDEELVATAHRHGGKDKAEAFFLSGMTRAMTALAQQSHPAFPISIYYAFKQSESDDDSGNASTGWETFLDAVLRSGLGVGATWPMRTEGAGRITAQEANALASSIVLACRPRLASAPNASRREFVAALKAELPTALARLQRGNIAPVDLAQAAIGPGMAVFTRYGQVLDAQGRQLSVRDALTLVNKVLDEVLAEEEGDFDADSRFALAWFEQRGFAEGEYGVAEVLARAKNTSVGGMEEAGILKQGHGKVRLLAPAELSPDWDPATDTRRPAWQVVHQLVRAADQGEAALAELLTKLGPEADTARELAYRLYVLCERRKRTTEALWYNGLVQSWPEAVRLAAATPAGSPIQGELFGEG